MLGCVSPCPSQGADEVLTAASLALPIGASWTHALRLMDACWRWGGGVWLRVTPRDLPNTADSIFRLPPLLPVSHRPEPMFIVGCLHL